MKNLIDVYEDKKICKMKSKIREWYMSSYPDDSLAEEINKGVTFEDLYNALKTHRDVYECLGVGDSFIRENCFSKLAKLLNKKYDYIYDLWLSDDEPNGYNNPL